MKRIFIFSAIFLLSGCASWFRSEVRQVASVLNTNKESTPAPIQMAPPVQREPGSIWSEASQWNVIYSPPLQRMVGDVITLKPTDNFRMTVAQRSGVGNNWEASQGRENSHIIAVIREVLPRQVYRVEAKQSIKVGTRDHEIELLAKIREQDISNDDGGVTDSLFDIDLKVKNEGNVAQAEGGQSTGPGGAQRGLASASPAQAAAQPAGAENANGQEGKAPAGPKSAKVASKEGEK